MNILKPTVLLVLYSLFLVESKAEIPKGILRKIIKATENLKSYEINFTRSFKYPNEKDTLIESYQSSIYEKDAEIYVGWHVINYKRSGSKRSIAASNGELVARLNFKDNIYYEQSMADNSDKFKANLKSYLYQPILMNREQYNAYSPSSETDDTYVYQKTDTIKDARLKVLYLANSTLYISKTSYLPIKEITITRKGNNIQYSAFELESIQTMDSKKYPTVKQQSDSFIQIIRSFQNGDSIKAARKELYRKLKVGDTVSMFKAMTWDGKPFDLNSKLDSVIVLDFFYTTCSPCIKALPELNKMHLGLRDLGVTIVGVDAFSSDWENLPAFIQHYGVNYDIVKVDKQVLYDYGVTGFPRMILVRNGVVIKIYFGYAVGIENDIRKLLETSKG